MLRHTLRVCLDMPHFAAVCFAQRSDLACYEWLLRFNLCV
ncbi:unnamed protein product [Chondrus crispus]|uniref:Uncharacterized protein n=1 Tax=Chondrus crispus TaxID=2769 RepID=R7Q3H7_CHOCR|nr:unnamed protein product [Chondrus crispus]CDF32443.1 unnamed protein product [Chondrus crispus]|eukprot:XP_005712108.1 unnamed protein product [Chondrus crispus]